MSSATLSTLSPDLSTLPGVWRAHTWPTAVERSWPSGHPALDEQLPGHGWPVGALVEVLQAPGTHHEWQLLLPALGPWQTHVPGPGLPARPGVVLVEPPHAAFGPALVSHGARPAAWVSVQAGTPTQCLWACEQALQCADVGAVLAWLPHVPLAALRRLQCAAARGGTLLWVFRPWAVQQQPSPAVLRLAVQADPQGEGLRVQVLKRRGPPLTLPVCLPRLGVTLQAVLAGARWRQRLRQAGLPTRSIEVPHDTHALVAGAGQRAAARPRTARV